MKSKILIMGILCTIAFNVSAQTKGTNTLGFGINSTSNKQTYSDISMENKTTSLSLGYGYFFEDNKKISLDLNFSKSDYSGNIDKVYGGNVSYQKYYPLVKTLFAYAGGTTGYNFSNRKEENYKNSYNQYSAGAFGGITWFPSKRFAFETTLLSANATYVTNKTTSVNNGFNSKTEASSFNLSSSGVINNLGFKIYLLF